MTSTPTSHASGQREYSAGAAGLTAFAAILMIMVGTFHAAQGLVALINDTFYVVGEEYVFQFDVTTWGWIHLLVGVVVAIAGFALFSGAVWARSVGVILAVVSAVANFLWMPYYPFWSMAIIALNVFVIWALTAHGRDITVA
ncbi:MAG TPA: hypothetical protein VK894_11765 [Jiangellales bacterium]|nr:hypothetical protein [Jiangellales bacterium]